MVAWSEVPIIKNNEELELFKGWKTWNPGILVPVDGTDAEVQMALFGKSAVRPAVAKAVASSVVTDTKSGVADNEGFRRTGKARRAGNNPFVSRKTERSRLKSKVGELRPTDPTLVDRMYRQLGFSGALVRLLDSIKEPTPCAKDPELFYEEKDKIATEMAIELCKKCPVVDLCLAAGLEEPMQFGVWGGMSAEDRKILKSRAMRRRRIEVTSKRNTVR